MKVYFILLFLATSYRRYDADNGVVFYSRLFLLQVSDVIIIHKDIDERGNLSIGIGEVPLKFREVAREFAYHFGHIASGHIKLSRVVSEFAERRRDKNSCHYSVVNL